MTVSVSTHIAHQIDKSKSKENHRPKRTLLGHSSYTVENIANKQFDEFKGKPVYNNPNALTVYVISYHNGTIR